MTTTVDNIEHIESQSLPGTGIVKIFFQPGADIRLATSQVAAVAPQIAIRQHAGRHPAAFDHQLQRLHRAGAAGRLFQQSAVGISEILDLAQNFIRPHLVSVRGRRHPPAVWRQGPRRSTSTWIPRRCRRTAFPPPMSRTP